MIGTFKKIIEANFADYNDQGQFNLFKTTLFPRKKSSEIVVRTLNYSDGLNLKLSQLSEPQLVNLIGMFAIIFGFDMNVFLIQSKGTIKQTSNYELGGEFGQETLQILKHEKTLYLL